uniref:Exonuclease domain-containing protein n=1 Tax=viral metagenome TaxID=1070528 RepID=A0A6C0IH13_9ZZZZ
MIIITFDTETTGLPKIKMITEKTLHLWPHIVQFSYVIYNNETNNILKTVDHIVKVPENIVISEENSNIHGITDTISKTSGQDIAMVLSEFMQDYNNADIIVAHNMEFDFNIIKVELMRQIYNDTQTVDEKEKITQNLNCLKASSKLCCTMQESIELCNIKALSKQGKEYVKFPSLAELHKHLFGVVPKKLHNSLNDVLICLRCFYKMHFEADIVAINEEVRSSISSLIS